MKDRVATMLLVFVFCLLTNVAQCTGQNAKPGTRKPVPVIVAWAGEAEDAVTAKTSRKIRSQADWRKVWTELRKDEQVPFVNFDDVLILVAIGDGVNGAASGPSIDENGDLRNFVAMTKMDHNPAFPQSTKRRYQLAVISKNGIKSIEGVPIDNK